jgi:hypothetical protein
MLFGGIELWPEDALPIAAKSLTCTKEIISW